MNERNEPFIAIVPHEARGEYFDRTHAVYLVNPLDATLANVYERVGGFFSTEEGVIEAQPNTTGPFEIAPRSAHLLEMSSQDEFDELVCWWSIAYEVNGEQRERTFSAGKALSNTTEILVCPILNRPALLVGR
jgi:hypothetical protein